MTRETYFFAAALPDDSSGGDDDSDVIMTTGYISNSSSSIQEKISYDEASQKYEEYLPAYDFLSRLPVQESDSLSYDEMESLRVRSDDPALHNQS
jgi:hypothetical protein